MRPSPRFIELPRLFAFRSRPSLLEERERNRLQTEKVKKAKDAWMVRNIARKKRMLEFQRKGIFLLRGRDG
ncbi:unnamed protein product [Urochloa humidicola]